MKFGRAFYVAWIALVITGIVGGLGLAFQQPWLFPSFGPTIFIHTVTPNQEAARPWNTFVGARDWWSGRLSFALDIRCASFAIGDGRR